MRTETAVTLFILILLGGVVAMCVREQNEQGWICPEGWQMHSGCLPTPKTAEKINEALTTMRK